MNNTKTPTVTYGETIILGRKDYGWGVEARLVTVDGETFIALGGNFYTPCGHCDDHGHSGSKAHFGGILGGVCFQCGGKGWAKRYDSIEHIARVAKRRQADRARAERKAAEKAAETRRMFNNWAACNGSVARDLGRIYDEMVAAGDDYAARDAVDAKWGGFLTGLANQVGIGRPLTRGQTDAASRAYREQSDRIRADRARRDAARYLGEIGDKVTGTGTVVVSTTVEDNYSPHGGSKALLVIEGTGDLAGVTFKTIGTGATLWGHERGDTVTVSGTVKAHSEYQGVKQTVLTRSEVQAAAE